MDHFGRRKKFFCGQFNEKLRLRSVT